MIKYYKIFSKGLEMHDYDFELNLDKRYKSELTSEETVEIVFSYISKITTVKNLDKQLMLMADLGRELIRADRCTVWLVDSKKDELWTKVAHGLNEIRIDKHFGIVGSAVKDGEPLIINDPYNDDRFDKDIDQKTGYHTNNVLVIPIKNSEDKIIGAYQAVNKLTKEAIFTQKDLDRLLLAVTYTGKELESSMLYKEIEDTQKEIIYTMAEIGETRSKETGNHVRRVAEYSKILASGYGLSDEEAELIKMASPMHDIGKIGIPDSILLKPGKLTEDEFKIMKTHSKLGYNMLKHSDRKILKASAIIAHEHHEKWNGKGYPRGLKGEEIHIYGRITAIADVFDALSSDRCYKKAWELEKVLNLLKEERGEHFDPKLIDTLFDRLDEILKYKKMYDDKFDHF
jgi:response regulator RpfG family c-di-GMP phosphodiesterase